MKKTTYRGPLDAALRTAIAALPLSLREISRESGVGIGSLSRFMARERSLALPLADKLANMLGMRVVFGRKKKGEKSSVAS